MSTTLVAEQCALTPPSVLADRFLWCAVLPSQSTETNLTRQPLLLALFEVTRSWFPESKLITSLEETLTAAAEQLTLSEPLDDQLEAILRAVNGTLNQVSEAGETDWIGNMNGLIAVLGADELHFSQTGACPSYLLTNNRIRQLTEPLVPEDLHPLKTFTSLASGTVSAGDQLLFATTELYRELSLDALRRTLQGTAPYTSISVISKELARVKNPKVAAIILAIHQSSGSRQAHPTIIALDTVFEPKTKKLKRTVGPIIAKGIHLSKSLGKKALEKAQQFHDATQHRRQKSVIETISPADSSEKEVQIGTVISGTSTKKKLGSTVSLPALKTFVTRVLPHVLAVSLNRSLLWLQVPQNRKFAALGVGVLIILLITVGAISRRTGSQNGATTTDTAFTTAEQAITAASNALTADMVDTAAKEAETAAAALLAISNPSGDAAAKWDQLWEKLSETTDTLTSTTRFTSASSSYSLPEVAHSFIVRAPYAYGISATTVSRTGSDTLANATLTLPAAIQESITASTLSGESTTAGYILTQNSKLLRISQIGTQSTLATIQPEDGEIAPGDSLATYGSNVYVLDGTSGLVWRYTGSGTSFSSGRSLFDPNKINLRQSISLAIDGSFYTLKRDGTIAKLTSNKLDETFSITGMPIYRGTLTNPKQITTDVSMSSIYVLDAGSTSARANMARVLEFTKDGRFLAQYAFPHTLGDVSAIQVDQRGGKLWALSSGNTISEFQLPIR